MKLPYTFRPNETAIGESLKVCAPLVEQSGKGEWNFILNNGSLLLVTARAAESWLHLDAPLPLEGVRTNDPWQLLRLNRDLGGLSKVASLNAQQGLRVRAEIPMDEEVDLKRRLTEACSGLKQAAGRLHGERKTDRLQRVSSSALSGGDEADATELRKLCEVSGWKFSERSGAKLAIDLEARAGFSQAIVEQRNGGGVLITVELARDASFGEVSKRALGTMLLRASALIRLGRAVAKEEPDTTTANFETYFQTAPCAAEFDHALASLSVASGLCGPAAEALRDEVVATNYLSSQGQGMKLRPTKEK